MTVVVTVLGDYAEAREGCCPWCGEPVPKKSVTLCWNRWCDAHYSWTQASLKKHREDKAKWQAAKAKREKAVAELQEELRRQSCLRREVAAERRREVEREGFCGRCYEMSNWETKVRHRGACTKRG